MLLNTPLPFVKTFVDELDNGLRAHELGKGLSSTQRKWLGFCLMGILLTNSICWASFERASLGKYKQSALSWMFHHSQIAWVLVLQVSVRIVLRQHGIKQGILSTDDSDHRRSKTTKRIFKAHKLKDKASGGYVNGQTIVLLVLVTPKVTLPVGFSFYQPDPVQREWKKEDERLKKKGVSKKNRPSAPAPNPEYPTKAQLALQLMEQFRHYHSQITVKAVVADALYGQQSFMDAASALFDGCQVVSQLRNNQNIRYRNRKYQLNSYFAKFQGISRGISIRGQEPLNAMVASARLEVCAHAKKRFVIALKYPGEKEYRYLVATDLSWRTIDIVQAYSLRWLVEVFIEDWKGYEGWAQLAKQQGKEGSSRGLSLSLLLDLCLLLHPEQLTRVENNLPAYTVGSLQRTIQMEALVVGIKQIVHTPNPAKQLALLTQSVKDFFVLRSSSKHMSGKDLGRLEPTPSLRHRAAA